MLLERGCLEKKYQNGYTRKILTKKGREAGIRAEERLSSKGNTYEIFLYTERAQHFLVDLIKEMITGTNGRISWTRKETKRGINI